MKRIGRKAVVVTITAVLGLGILGTAAFAAFAPSPADTFELVPSLPGVADAPKVGGDKLKTLLDTLVTKGVITQQQEDAILAALQTARTGDRTQAEFLKKALASLFDQSATYLGMTGADLKAKLPGTSLAAIANATPGKSRDALVAYLVNAANEAITKAQSAGTITPDQANTARTAAPKHIASFVDHAYPAGKPRTHVAPHAVVPSLFSFIGDEQRAAREYLGLSEKDLVTAVHSGKSLGEIADSTPGKTRAGLIATLTNTANAKIDEAQKDGKLTADQATQFKAKVADTVTHIVDGKAKAPTKSH